jgi:molybdopterin-guanine dinucleotide biosynthesis protein A
MAAQEIRQRNGLSTLTVAIQAGGASSRMGRDKSFVPYQGRPMIEVVREKVEGLGDELIVITNNPAQYAHLNLPTYSDLYPDHGPLAGIFTALSAASYAHVLVVACDMPLLNKPLLRYLMSLKETADVVVPRWDRFPEPLHAVYSKACLPTIEPYLKARKLKITGFYAEVAVRYVEREEIERFDPQGRSFTNVNTPEDLSEHPQA